MNVKQISLSLIFLFLAYSLFSQNDFREGYIITNDNDTILGLINYRGDLKNAKSCEFKTDKSSKITKYKADDIKAYRFKDGKFYLSSHLFQGFDKGDYFIEFLINGIIDIYYCRVLEDEYYFIKKEDGKLYELDNEHKEKYIKGKGDVIVDSKKYIGYLKVAMADCPEVQKDIENSHLGHKSMINIAKKYHDIVCEGEECIIYEKKISSSKFKVTPFSRFSFYDLKYIGGGLLDGGFYDLFEFNKSHSFGFGVSVNISFPRINEKISLELDVMSGNMDMIGSFERDYSSAYEIYDYTLDSKVFNTSLAFKYRYPVWKIKPFIAVGLSNFLFTKVNVHVIRERDFGTELFITEVSNVPFSKSMLGIFGRVGFDLQMTKKLELMTNFEYRRNTGPCQAPFDTVMRVISNNLNIGISYSLN